MDLDLVEEHAVDEFAGFPVKDTDIGLESHVGDLSGGDVATGAGDGEAADLVGVAGEEFGGTRVADFTDDYTGTEGVEEVATVRVHAETTGDVTAEADG